MLTYIVAVSIIPFMKNKIKNDCETLRIKVLEKIKDSRWTQLKLSKKMEVQNATFNKTLNGLRFGAINKLMLIDALEIMKNNPKRKKAKAEKP
jgi:hypothetical protein